MPLAVEACKDLAKKDWYGWEWAYIQCALSLLGQSDEQAAAARTFRQKPDRFPIPDRDRLFLQKQLAYWTGEVRADALLEAAGGSRRKLCRAHYFIGLSELGHGKRSAARDQFRAAVATGDLKSRPWIMSRTLLGRLEKEPAWPPWILKEK